MSVNIVIIGYKSAIICNVFSIGPQWYSNISFLKNKQTRKKWVAVLVTIDISLLLQQKKKYMVMRQ